MNVIDTLTYYSVRDEKRELVAFLQRHHWPYHSNHESGEVVYEQAFDEGKYHGKNLAFWVEQFDKKIGLVVIEDIDDLNPMLDIRLASNVRGKGLGKHILQWMTDYTFINHEKVIRLEGCTRIDNLAMRKTFHSVGFVKEAYYRSGWVDGDGTVFDCLSYAKTRSDWVHGTITPIQMDNEPF
ncbi:hypothetical protein DH09_13325 [Bacillaceae bacterium JMAK1]|nr:hypothetical protein DH09_13325 [Bacillaceae bacterium JMAK1]